MKNRSGKIRGRYLGVGIIFGLSIGAILQTLAWGAALGLAIGLTWAYAQSNRIKS